MLPKYAICKKKFRAQYDIEMQQEQSNQQKMHTAISLGSTLIGAFMGRKISRYSSDNASSLMRGIARTSKEKKDIERAIQTRELYEQQLIDLENEFKAEIAELDYKIKNNIEEVETITIKLDKKDISVKLISLTWIPTFDNTV